MKKMLLCAAALALFGADRADYKLKVSADHSADDANRKVWDRLRPDFERKLARRLERIDLGGHWDIRLRKEPSSQGAAWIHVGAERDAAPPTCSSNAGTAIFPDSKADQVADVLVSMAWDMIRFCQEDMRGKARPGNGTTIRIDTGPPAHNEQPTPTQQQPPPPAPETQPQTAPPAASQEQKPIPPEIKLPTGQPVQPLTQPQIEPPQGPPPEKPARPTLETAPAQKPANVVIQASAPPAAARKTTPTTAASPTPADPPDPLQKPSPMRRKPQQ